MNGPSLNSGQRDSKTVAAVMAAVQAYLDDEAVAEVDEGLPMNPSWRMAAWLPTVDPWACVTGLGPVEASGWNAPDFTSD